MPRTTEPFWWFLFIGGATIAAIFVPVHIIITGIAGPLGLLGDALDYERVLDLVSHPVAKLYLLALISLPLFHWAHRFRFTVVDLGLKTSKRVIAVACYGTAVVVLILTVLVLIRL